MKDKKDRVVRSACVLAIICSFASVAVAGFPPGYLWGLANCGPAVNDTEEACLLCCDHAGDELVIPAGDVSGCQQACRESVFTGPPSLWERFSLWLFG